jgi:hypothetical protein
MGSRKYGSIRAGVVSKTYNDLEVSEEEVVGLIQNFWWDKINHHFDIIFLECCYPHCLRDSKLNIGQPPKSGTLLPSNG